MKRRYCSDYGPRLIAQSIYEESDTQKHDLGARFVLGDRVFRYIHVGGTATVAGKVYQAPAIDTYDEDIVIPTSSAASSKTVYLTNHASHAAVTADQYKDGYLAIGAGASGIGTMYKIKANTAAIAGALLTLTLYDELILALTAATHTGCIVACPYMDVVIDAGTGLVVGVSPIAITAAYYGWVQTWGPVAAISGGAITAGEPVDANGDGTVIVGASSSTKPCVGMAMTTYDSGDAGPIYLQIAS